MTQILEIYQVSIDEINNYGNNYRNNYYPYILQLSSTKSKRKKQINKYKYAVCNKYLP